MMQYYKPEMTALCQQEKINLFKYCPYYGFFILVLHTFNKTMGTFYIVTERNIIVIEIVYYSYTGIANTDTCFHIRMIIYGAKQLPRNDNPMSAGKRIIFDVS
jgi:hypothetical protein